MVRMTWWWCIIRALRKQNLNYFCDAKDEHSPLNTEAQIFRCRKTRKTEAEGRRGGAERRCTPFVNEWPLVRESTISKTGRGWKSPGRPGRERRQEEPGAERPWGAGRGRKSPGPGGVGRERRREDLVAPPGEAAPGGKGGRTTWGGQTGGPHGWPEHRRGREPVLCCNYRRSWVNVCEFWIHMLVTGRYCRRSICSG